jgi:hypothetical protein
LLGVTVIELLELFVTATVWVTAVDDPETAVR